MVQQLFQQLQDQQLQLQVLYSYTSTGASFSLAGTNFQSVPIVELISSTGAITRASAVTFNNSTSLTVTTNLQVGSYFVRVENNDGGAVRSSSAILA